MKKITAPLLLVGILDSLYSNTLEENREFWFVLPDTFDKIVKQSI